MTLSVDGTLRRPYSSSVLSQMAQLRSNKGRQAPQHVEQPRGFDSLSSEAVLVRPLSHSWYTPNKRRQAFARHMARIESICNTYKWMKEYRHGHLPPVVESPTEETSEPTTAIIQEPEEVSRHGAIGSSERDPGFHKFSQLIGLGHIHVLVEE
ncbi:hypothetical protein PROFUN_10055 [Planoprotostelium fungivorum]|uniref:Uncharacterized protein n=1 Tax=Planoprotostelium fungivorum TaxID=1890364 RepID=A0A2P6NFI4_9EUKA|nr:hypothetical protein PROFUN_10055 [Planoprotostelium fungivorum]